MRQASLVLACLTWTYPGLLAAGKQSQSNERLGKHNALSPLEPFARLLLTFSNDAGFHSSGVGAPLPARTQRTESPVMGDMGDIKPGLTIKDNGQLLQVVKFLHVKPGKGAAFVRSTLKNIQTGAITEKTWRSSDSFEEAYIDKRQLTFSYEDGDDIVFMDMESFEEERVPKEVIGDRMIYISAEKPTVVKFHDDKAFDIDLPESVQLEIVKITDEGRSDTAKGVNTMTVMLTNDMEVEVPTFCKVGEMVVVSTETGKYMKRISEGGKKLSR